MDNRFDIAQLASELASLPEGQDYPLELWQPANCGTLPLVIDTNGQWWSIEDNNTRSAYRRPKIIHLLSKLLWCEPAQNAPKHYTPGDMKPQYSLKTPHESVHIQVEDVPFTIIDYTWQDVHNTPAMLCSTNLGESILVGIEHPICIHTDTPHLPYVKVRRNLWARFNRNVYYRLIEELLTTQPENTEQLSIESQGQHFIIAGGGDENS